MDKETEIQEATKIISDTVIKLFNAGYRKADEVRKETAKALLEEFCNFLNTNLLALMLSNQLGQDYDIDDKWNKFLLKQYEKYGVEVENDK